THLSTTDPEARLYKKADGQTAMLSYAAHALMENRSGLLVDLRISKATGSSGHTTALAMLEDELPLAPADHGRSRQGLRHVGLRRRLSSAQRGSSRRTKRVGSPLSHRPAHQRATRVLHLAARAEAGRRDLRLGENRRELPANA